MIERAAGRDRRPADPAAPPTDDLALAQLLRLGKAAVRALLEASCDPLVVTDTDGRILLASRGTEELFGYDRAELRGHAVDVLLADRDRAAHADLRVRTGSQGCAAFPQEFAGRRRGGDEFPLEVVPTRVPFPGGALILEVLRDVGERRRAEEALRASEERFRLLVDGAHDHALILLDADGCVQAWNPGAERLTGYAADEIVGQPVARLYPPEDAAAGRPADVRAAAAAADRYAYEDWRVRKDGTRFWADIVLTPLRDGAGALRGFATVTRDATERKAAEDERARLLAQEQAAVRLRDLVLATVSHDLRNPISTVRVAAEALRDLAGQRGRVDARVAAVAADIERAARRMGRMVEELTDVAALDAGEGLVLRATRTDLVALARRVARDHAALTGRTVAVADAPRTLVGRWDGGRVERLLDNLVANALKYSRAPSPIALSVARERDAAGVWAVLRVADRGIGVPPEELPHVFDLFRRGAGAPARAAGSGVGLGVVRAVAAAHGGSAAVESTPGVGTTVTVRLPLTPGRCRPAASRSAARASAAGRLVASRGRVRPLDPSRVDRGEPRAVRSTAAARLASEPTQR